MHNRPALTPSEPLPQPVAQFVDNLEEAIPKASLEIDRPRDPDGEWWLDVACGSFRSNIAWRQGHGFGVFTSELGYTDQPDEVYRTPELAWKRIQQLFRHWEQSSKLLPLSLSDVRELCETSQMTLAAALEKHQPAVSRLEHRDDMMLSSLSSYFRAMGGRLEMRVHFDSFDAAVLVPAFDQQDATNEEAS